MVWVYLSSCVFLYVCVFFVFFYCFALSSFQFFHSATHSSCRLFLCLSLNLTEIVYHKEPLFKGLMSLYIILKEIFFIVHHKTVLLLFFQTCFCLVSFWLCWNIVYLDITWIHSLKAWLLISYDICFLRYTGKREWLMFHPQTVETSLFNLTSIGTVLQAAETWVWMCMHFPEFCNTVLSCYRSCAKVYMQVCKTQKILTMTMEGFCWKNCKMFLPDKNDKPLKTR